MKKKVWRETDRSKTGICSARAVATAPDPHFPDEKPTYLPQIPSKVLYTIMCTGRRKFQLLLSPTFMALKGIKSALSFSRLRSRHEARKLEQPPHKVSGASHLTFHDVWQRQGLDNGSTTIGLQREADTFTVTSTQKSRQSFGGASEKISECGGRQMQSNFKLVDELIKGIEERMKNVEDLVKERDDLQRRCDEVQKKYDQRKEDEESGRDEGLERTGYYESSSDNT